MRFQPPTPSPPPLPPLPPNTSMHHTSMNSLSSDESRPSRPKWLTNSAAAPSSGTAAIVRWPGTPSDPSSSSGTTVLATPCSHIRQRRTSPPICRPIKPSCGWQRARWEEWQLKKPYWFTRKWRKYLVKTLGGLTRAKQILPPQAFLQITHEASMRSNAPGQTSTTATNVRVDFRGGETVAPTGLHTGL